MEIHYTTRDIDSTHYSKEMVGTAVINGTEYIEAAAYNDGHEVEAKAAIDQILINKLTSGSTR